MEVKQWEIYMCDLGDKGVGSEQKYIRPVVIIQNDIGNKYSPTTIVAVATTSKTKKDIPTHLHKRILEDSIILFEQIKTIDKRRLIRKVGELSPKEIKEAKEKIKISLGL